MTAKRGLWLDADSCSEWMKWINLRLIDFDETQVDSGIGVRAREGPR